MSNQLPYSDLLLEALRERIHANVKEELEKIVQPVIDKFVDEACAQFEVRLMQHRDLYLDQLLIKYSVERKKS